MSQVEGNPTYFFFSDSHNYTKKFCTKYKSIQMIQKIGKNGHSNGQQPTFSLI